MYFYDVKAQREKNNFRYIVESQDIPTLTTYLGPMIKSMEVYIP